MREIQFLVLIRLTIITEKGAALIKSPKKVFSFTAIKGAIFGFYAYLLASAVDYFYYLFTGSVLFLPGLIFWFGLLVFFTVELISNLTDIFDKNSLDN